jgi:Gpi18-like mannosyltransferase
MTKRRLILFLVLGLVIRLAIGYFQFSGDLKNHLVWGNSFLEAPFGFFSRHFFGFNDPNYPPLAILLFAFSNLLYSICFSIINFLNQSFSVFPSFLVPLFSSENMQMLFLKLPGIFSDLGIAFVLYLFSRKLKITPLIFLIFLFNPAFIYTSTVWGQIEPVTSFFLILSLYQGIYGKQKYLSLIVFALAVLTKQTALWLTPLFFCLWWKEIRPKYLFLGLFGALVTFFFFYLPFGLAPWGAIKSYLATLSGSSTLVSDAAWNIWYFIFPGRVEDSLLLGFLSVRTISIIILLASLVLIVKDTLIEYSHARLLRNLFFWSLLVFFIQTRVHERHLYFALLFLLLSPKITKVFWLEYLPLSVYHYLNLYQSLGLPFIK